jgi:glyoxylase-like metal-dependent hydrolase (beta-lactamase superfamily II)
MALSRRDFLASSVLGIAAGALARPELARAWQQQTPPVTPVFTPMRRNVGFFTGRGGTIGWLINSTGVVVVDSQYPDAARLCLDGLNERSKNRPVDLLINTHHHADHTAGNVVFKGIAKKVVANARAVELQRDVASKATPPTEQLYADTTFVDEWHATIGDEVIRARTYTPAHTSGDAIVIFERANVVHMGDLMFNRLHPFIDRPAGASVQNWIKMVEDVAKAHATDTIYVFGHAGAKSQVTGDRAELLYMRDYLTALLVYVRAQIKAGKSRDAIIASTDVLKGFEDYGPLIPRALTATYDEVVGA